MTGPVGSLALLICYCSFKVQPASLPPMGNQYCTSEQEVGCEPSEDPEPRLLCCPKSQKYVLIVPPCVLQAFFHRTNGRDS